MKSIITWFFLGHVAGLLGRGLVDGGQMLRTSNIELRYQGTFIKVMVFKNNYDF